VRVVGDLLTLALDKPGNGYYVRRMPCIPDGSIAYLLDPKTREPVALCFVRLVRSENPFGDDYYSVTYYQEGTKVYQVADGKFLEVCEDQGAAMGMWELMHA